MMMLNFLKLVSQQGELNFLNVILTASIKSLMGVSGALNRSPLHYKGDSANHCTILQPAKNAKGAEHT